MSAPAGSVQRRVWATNAIRGSASGDPAGHRPARDDPAVGWPGRRPCSASGLARPFGPTSAATCPPGIASVQSRSARSAVPLAQARALDDVHATPSAPSSREPRGCAGSANGGLPSAAGRPPRRSWKSRTRCEQCDHAGFIKAGRVGGTQPAEQDPAQLGCSGSPPCRCLANVPARAGRPRGTVLKLRSLRNRDGLMARKATVSSRWEPVAGFR